MHSKISYFGYSLMIVAYTILLFHYMGYNGFIIALLTGIITLIVLKFFYKSDKKEIPSKDSINITQTVGKNIKAKKAIISKIIQKVIFGKGDK